MLKNDATAEAVLEQLAQSAFQVVEGAVPESVAEDTRVGFYVAFHQILADNLVRVNECGTLTACDDLREDHPFSISAPLAHARA